MKYTRTNIYLLEQDKRELEEIAEKEGKKFSELVRVIMRNYINEKKLK
jgi:metal-responsive CopG/Arc/MetJ family transcriptional regulator